jgi:hypothetical protein
MITFKAKNNLWEANTLENVMFCECVELRSIYDDDSSLLTASWRFCAWEYCKLCLATGVPPIPCSELPAFGKVDSRHGPRYNWISPSYAAYQALTGRR